MGAEWKQNKNMGGRGLHKNETCREKGQPEKIIHVYVVNFCLNM